MITLTKLCQLLEGLGIPWANQKFIEEPAPPFIVLVAGFGNGVPADNTNWLDWREYDLALYTKNRDYALEEKIEGALRNAECNYDSIITNLNDENLVEAAFSIVVNEKE